MCGTAPAARAEAWAQEHQGAAAASIADAVAGCDAVFMCLGDDPDVRDVGSVALSAMARGAVLVDHTTASAELARELSEAAAQRGLDFVDAPVSGGQAGAENGGLTIMCGGEALALDRVRPALSAYGARITHMGPVGAGQLTKMVNQIAIAGLVQGLAEAAAFAQAAGLDLETVQTAIGGGAAQSWQMDNRLQTMASDEYDFGFAVDWMRKDLRIALEEARRNGAQAPVAALVDQFYAEIQAMGGGRWDTSSLKMRLNPPNP